jgi:hypothetical protein
MAEKSRGQWIVGLYKAGLSGILSTPALHLKHFFKPIVQIKH